MKIKAILAAIAVAVTALAFTSCEKSGTDMESGDYYMVPTATTSGHNSDFVMLCHQEIRNALGTGVIFMTSENNKKAIAACDKVFESYQYLITISFELTFKTAFGEGETPKKTVIKTYKPAN